MYLGPGLHSLSKLTSGYLTSSNAYENIPSYCLPASLLSFIVGLS